MGPTGGILQGGSRTTMAMIGSADEVAAAEDSVTLPDAGTVAENGVDAPLDTEPIAAADRAGAREPGSEPSEAINPAPPEPPIAAPPEHPAIGRQSTFLAELARAMHAAAEVERAAVLERSRFDAEVFTEQLQKHGAEEEAGLREGADADVAGIREWSRSEIARIRDETERRIAERRSDLESELERHAAAVQRRMERLQHRVAAFEAEMGEFFERLLAEPDPARFAALAARLPEPPMFEMLDRDDAEPATVAIDHDPERGALNEGDAADQQVVGGDEPAPRPPEAAAGDHEAGHSFAEAEAAAAADAADDEDGAGTAPGNAAVDEDGEGASLPSAATQVVVVGLVSVASIAGFKRQLGHLEGVTSVGVSSGPDGEFVFRVTHAADVVLRELVPSLPGFQARVVSSAAGVVHVSARDPESEA